jgi:hypothetical protein
MPMIFSVGYQKLTQAELGELVKDLDALLIDCRSYPSGRVKKGFSKADLAAALGERYVWKGDVLGGKGRKATPEGLEWLKAQDGRLLLMCMEHSPGDCHRHYDIAVPLAADGVVVRHIFEQEVIDAPDLQAAIVADTEYEYEELKLVLAELAE